MRNNEEGGCRKIVPGALVYHDPTGSFGLIIAVVNHYVSIWWSAATIMQPGWPAVTAALEVGRRSVNRIALAAHDTYPYIVQS